MFARSGFLLLAAIAAPLALSAEEATPVKSTIESVGLFKNGTFVVRETIPISGAGTYHLDTIPHAIHGTLWFESEAVFEARTVTREESRPAISPRSIVEAALLYPDRRVYLELTDGKKVTGVIVAPSSAEDTPSPLLSSLPTSGGNIITLRTGVGVEHILASSVRSITYPDPVDGEPQVEPTHIVTIPSLELIVRETAGDDATITMTYLTEGMAWAPSYRVDYDQAGSARITMSTIVRNEWRDMEDTRVDLISGFPQIEFSRVKSPLSLESSLATFFTQLSSLNASSGSAVMAQMVMSNRAMPTSSMAPAMPDGLGGAGEDLHFHDIGSVTLTKGSAISRHIASADASAQRFVDWRITDDRDMFGRNDGDEREHDAWDSIRFTNPFDFALTTAPASVWMDGKFRGQSTATYTNPGAEAIIKTTKALSVETKHEEFDIERGDPRRIMNGDYQPVVVRAEMTITNRRDSAASIEIAREFQGTYQTSSDEPKQKRSVSKRNAINPSNEVKWELEIPAGEERVVTIDYEVMVRI